MPGLHVHVEAEQLNHTLQCGYGTHPVCLRGCICMDNTPEQQCNVIVDDMLHAERLYTE